MTGCRCPQGDCGPLATAAAAGDVRAGQALAVRFGPLAATIARRTLGRHRPVEDVEDATQVALLKLFANLHKWRGECPFCKFAAVVFARRVIEVARGEPAWLPLGEAEPPDHRGLPPDPALLARLDAALNTFPVEWRTAWWLAADGVSQEAIGQRVGRAARTVRVWLAAVRQKLAAELDTD